MSANSWQELPEGRTSSKGDTREQVTRVVYLYGYLSTRILLVPYKTNTIG
jgi:hypothetical protein